MGGCVSRRLNHQQRYHQHQQQQRRRRRRSSNNHSALTTNGCVRRNKPLNRAACSPKWKAEVPITEEQLRRKREEYWDTAPAFDGRKEIWDALHGTCYAIEQNDIDLAQSILNCANISLPNGTLFDCYDELGTRYQLPFYVLSAPINLIDNEQASVNSRVDYESASSDSFLGTIIMTNDPRDENSISADRSKKRTTPTNDGSHVEIPIKFRLSNGNEHRIICKSTDKIRTIKKRLIALENGSIDKQTQRFCFGGQLLADRTTIGETALKRNFVVQVILNDSINTNA